MSHDFIIQHYQHSKKNLGCQVLGKVIKNTSLDGLFYLLIFYESGCAILYVGFKKRSELQTRTSANLGCQVLEKLLSLFPYYLYFFFRNSLMLFKIPSSESPASSKISSLEPCKVNISGNPRFFTATFKRSSKTT